MNIQYLGRRVEGLEPKLKIKKEVLSNPKLVEHQTDLGAFVKIEDLSVDFLYEGEIFDKNNELVTFSFSKMHSKDKSQMLHVLNHKTKDMENTQIFIFIEENPNQFRQFFMDNRSFEDLGTVGKDLLLQNEDEVKTLEHDENYYKGKLNDLVTQQGIWKFCVETSSYDYNHCGPDCGQGKTYGGGYAVNDIDLCCYYHDRCWQYNQKSVSCCDNDLIVCARKVYYQDESAYNLIYGYFGPSAFKCRG